MDLDDPFRDAAEHRAEIDFLERIAAEVLARNLADEEHQRRRILLCRVDRDARVRGARAPRHEAHARPAGQLADRLGHVRGIRLVAARYEPQPIANVVKRIEHVKVAFARDREGQRHALLKQAVDERARGGRCGAGDGVARLAQSRATGPHQPGRKPASSLRASLRACSSACVKLSSTRARLMRRLKKSATGIR